MQFISLIGSGSVIFLEEESEKKKTLRLLTDKYAHVQNAKFSEEEVDAVCTFKICIDTLSGKQSFSKKTITGTE